MSADWWQTETNDGVATKRELWEPIAKRIGGFDLDPASGCEPTPIAATRYTKEDDGLAHEWFGNVWLNPPFSKKERWFKRLCDQYEQGNIDRAVGIANAGTDTDWFHDWFTTADKIVFLDGRDWYIQSGTENFASMLGVWNPTNELEKWLSGIGTVMIPKRDTEQQRLDL